MYQSDMLNYKHRFDPYLPQANVEALKKACRLWGGNSQLKKAECIAVICKGLANPQKVKEVVAALQPHERTALKLCCQMKGIIGVEALGIGLMSSGVTIPASNSFYKISDFVSPLLEKGLFLCDNQWNAFSFNDSYKDHNIFSDYRLLEAVEEAVEELECKTLTLTPAANPDASIIRQGAVVSLGLMGILQAIENLKGLTLTKSGDVRVNELRRLAKILQWQNDQISIDGLIFPQPTLALVSVLVQAKFLTPTEEKGHLILKYSVEEFAAFSYSEKISPLLWGFFDVKDWQEGTFTSRSDASNYANARLALTLVLKSIPVDTEAFWTIEQLDQVLYNRVGEYFALRKGSRFRLRFYDKTPEIEREIRAKLRQEERQEWQKIERQWLEKALTTWLYFLGIVEIGLNEGKPLSFRITPLGKQILHPQLSPETSLSGVVAPQPSWLVQPNFEIVVYLNATTSQQLAFLERHAQRLKIEQHVAIYRLTRESVYHALEKGSSLAELLQKLQAGSQVPLPQNVLVDLHSWGQLREELTLHQHSKLVEFSDNKAREDALKQGKFKGRPVGDRFLLLTQKQTINKTLIPKIINYSQKLPPCISVSEKGKIQLTTTPDFFLPQYLDKWAQRQSEITWQLTYETVKKVVQMGGVIDELFYLFKDRLDHKMPPYLEVALKGWAGKFKKVELADVVVMRCSDSEVFELIVHHQDFNDYWLSILAYGILLVDKSQVKVLKTQLAQLGLTVSDELKIES